MTSTPERSAIALLREASEHLWRLPEAIRRARPSWDIATSAEECAHNIDALLAQPESGALRSEKREQGTAYGEDEWNLVGDQPFVSAWRWIEYWTADGFPGVRRFHIGDNWLDSSIACWRFVKPMPPYAAAPVPSTGNEES